MLALMTIEKILESYLKRKQIEGLSQKLKQHA